MSRYIAPEHTSSVFLPTTGELRVNSSGQVSLAADAPAHDHEALRAAGFRLAGAPADKAQNSVAKPTAKRNSSKKGKAAKAKAPTAPAPAKPAAQPEGGAAEQPQG